MGQRSHNGKHGIGAPDPDRVIRAAAPTASPAVSPVGPIIGREPELADIARCIDDGGCRLVSLVGLGGVGKTRVAWELARRLGHAFLHGAYFVALTPLSSPDRIVPTLAAALDFSLNAPHDPADQLLDYLSGRQLLLILDNFEHLLAGADFIADMLRSAPHLRVLVTSRERLNLREEWVFDIAGLAYPSEDTDRRADQYEALQLFVAAARHSKADFRLTGENQADVIRICRLVEGLPLAIELAAAWVRTLSCRAIGDEIERTLDLLASGLRDWPERHRSLRAVFAQSWMQLSPEERRALERLTVFRAGFARDAGRAVAAADLGVLTGLLDKALLRAGHDDRYDMHSLVCQYATEQLEAAQLSDQARDAHCDFFAEFVAQRVADLKGRRQVEALREINTDFENIRAAWQWAVESHDIARIGKLLEGVWLFGTMYNRERDCQALIDDAARSVASAEDEAAQRVWARLIVRGSEGTATSSEELLTTALKIARRADDHAELAHCLKKLGRAKYAAGEHTNAEDLLEQSLAAYRRVNDPFYVADALFDLSVMGHDVSWERVKAAADESLRLRTAIGDRIGTAMSLWVRALLAARVGDFEGAERLWRERIALGVEVNNQNLVALGHAHVSYQVYFVRGDFAAARQAAEDAMRIAQAHGFSDALGWAQVTLGVLALMNEDYPNGIALCQRGAASGFLVDIAEYAAWGLCLGAWGMGDTATMQRNLPAALHYNTMRRGDVGKLLCLPIAAQLLSVQGQPLRAVEWLALAFTHPLRACAWMEQWPLLTRRRTELERTLGSQVYSAAWQRGSQRDLDAVIGEVRGWGEGPGGPGSQGSRSQALIEPLTPRELDVLHLMADGLSNPSIAKELILSVGTVKAHTSSIYGKLGVASRVQAVARARTLGLV